jgi:hypothetical protein
MKVTLMAVVCAVFAALLTHGSTLADAVTPMQKVVEMLNGMMVKGKEEKHAEMVQFAAFKQFCGDAESEKTKVIAETKEQITMLTADIEKNENEAEVLWQNIGQLNGDIATFSGDMKAATKVRAIEREDYLKVHKDYTQSIDACVAAVQVLKARGADTAQAGSASLMQALNSSASSPLAAHRAIEAFLAIAVTSGDAISLERQEPSGALATQSTPEVNAYEFKSKGIVNMLEKLRDKFVDERSTIEAEETQKRHGHDMLIQDLSQSTKTAQTAKANKETARAKNLQSVATMKGDLGDATLFDTEETTALGDLKGNCKQKAIDFEARQKLRGEELTALNKAVEILSQDVPASMGPGLLQRRKTSGTALFQLRSSNQSPNQADAIKFLNAEADKLNSQVLSALAIRVQDDPFVKVKKLIQDLIGRLQEEANEAAQHEGWCKTELSENEGVRTSRTTLVERLASEIEQDNAAITKLSSEVTILTQDIADMEKSVADATQQRNHENAENEQTVKDSQDAQTAVQRAVTVLREFYAVAGEATASSLVQQEQHAQAARQEPEVFGSEPYQGMGGESGGVLAMLEVIESDYARLESQTTAMEETAKLAFDKFMSDTATSKATAEKDVEHKNREKQALEQAVMDATNDLESGKKELDAATKYFEKLKPTCLNTGMDYEERTAKRKEEIESLKEALKILSSDSMDASS